MKRFNSKQWIGAALVVLGVILLIFSHTIRSDVGEEMGKVKTIIGPLSQIGQGGRFASDAIEGRAKGKAAGYLHNAQFLMIGGIALIVVEGCLIFLCKKTR